MSNSWFNLIPFDELEEKGSAVVRKGGKQIALFLRDGQVFACNNRCPHEGYPLSEGSLDDQCVLTCNWHNWKFDLATGENVYRGDQLRVYPVELRDGDIWLDLTDPPQTERRESILRSLRAAFDEHDYERLAREAGRWKLADGDPVDIVKQAIQWTYDSIRVRVDPRICRRRRLVAALRRASRRPGDSAYLRARGGGTHVG